MDFSNTVILTIDEIKHETEAAILVVYEGKEYWLPKSRIDHEGEVGETEVRIEIETWLAEEKEMI